MKGRVLVLFEKTRLVWMTAIEAVGVKPDLREGFRQRQRLWDARQQRPAEIGLDMAVEFVNQLILAGKIMVDDPGADARALCYQRHGRTMKAALGYQLQCRLKNRCSFVLCGH